MKQIRFTQTIENMTFQLSGILYIGISVLLFYLLAPAYRKFLLCLASLVFCGFLDKYALVVLAAVTTMTYLSGFAVDKAYLSRDWIRKTVFSASVVIFIGLFFLWKYSYFIEKGPFAGLILPLGFSFYCFQAISYLTDIYKGKYGHERDPAVFLLYMSWFPKFTSGPIERADQFLPQAAKLDRVRLFNGSRIIRALSYIIWGLFLKLMLADRMSVPVDNIFGKHNEFGSIMLIIGSLLYTFQIYCDFAGYTDIAIGVSELFGIELTENFRTPYFAENITQFWRSWHITLSSFLRDYVYIPLGGNKKGNIRKYVNIMIVFIICGLWHGRGMKFLAWGILHGLYSIFTGLITKTRLSFLIKGVIGRIVTFCLVSFAWIFFRAESLKLAVDYIISIFTAKLINRNMDFEMEKAGTTPLELIILGLALAVLFISDRIAYRKKTLVPDMMIRTGEIRRDLCLVLLSVVVLIFGIYGNLEVKNFIYMEF